MIKRFDDFLDSFSKWGVIVCLAFMMSLSVLNIALRWFGVSLVWIEPLVRHLVFLAAFFGGSLATGKSEHIKIDLLSKIMENTGLKKHSITVERIVVAASLLACIILVYAGWGLYIVEKEYGQETFLGIHSSTLISIIFVGMSLIGIRFFLRLFIMSHKAEERG